VHKEQVLLVHRWGADYVDRFEVGQSGEDTVGSRRRLRRRQENATEAVWLGGVVETVVRVGEDEHVSFSSIIGLPGEMLGARC
jgi:hypothetical protein